MSVVDYCIIYWFFNILRNRLLIFGLLSIGFLLFNLSIYRLDIGHSRFEIDDVGRFGLCDVFDGRALSGWFWRRTTLFLCRVDEQNDAQGDHDEGNALRRREYRWVIAGNV